MLSLTIKNWRVYLNKTTYIRLHLHGKVTRDPRLPKRKMRKEASSAKEKICAEQADRHIGIVTPLAPIGVKNVFSFVFL